MEKPLPVFSLDEPKVEEELRRCIGKKRNIVLIGDSEQAIHEMLSRIVALNDYKPDTIHRWGIYALSDVVVPDDLSRMLEADRQKKTICIVEQLKLPLTKPPEVKNVIVYSEPQGVIADAETVEEAKGILEKHQDRWKHLERFPLAGIYQWQNQEWRKLRVFV
jgi:hypothetical protein